MALAISGKLDQWSEILPAPWQVRASSGPLAGALFICGNVDKKTGENIMIT